MPRLLARDRWSRQIRCTDASHAAGVARRHQGIRPGNTPPVSLHPREGEREGVRKVERDHFRNYHRIHCGGSPDTSRRALNLENFGINYGALYRIRLACLKFKLELASLVNNNWIQRWQQVALFGKFLIIRIHHLSSILEIFGSQ